MSTQPQAAALTGDSCLAVDGNRPPLRQGHGPRRGTTQWQHDTDLATASGGITSNSHRLFLTTPESLSHLSSWHTHASASLLLPILYHLLAILVKHSGPCVSGVISGVVSGVLCPTMWHRGHPGCAVPSRLEVDSGLLLVMGPGARVSGLLLPWAQQHQAGVVTNMVCLFQAAGTRPVVTQPMALHWQPSWVTSTQATWHPVGVFSGGLLSSFFCFFFFCF